MHCVGRLIEAMIGYICCDAMVDRRSPVGALEGKLDKQMALWNHGKWGRKIRRSWFQVLKR